MLARAQGLLGGELLKKALSEGLTGVEAALLGQGGLPAALSSSAAQGALVLDTTDVDKARSFLEAQAHSAGAHTRATAASPTRYPPTGWPRGSCTASR